MGRLLLVGVGVSAALATARADEPKYSPGFDWAARPSARDFEHVFPSKAVSRNQGGAAAIRCIAKADGSIGHCLILEEKPEGFGFGDAAVALAPRFRLPRLSPGGVSVEGATVTIPIRFSLGSSAPTLDNKDYPPEPCEPIDKACEPAWRAKPTASTVLRFFPKQFLKSSQNAAVALGCTLKPSTDIENCKVLAADPDLPKVSDAALEMAPTLLLSAKKVDGENVATLVVIPIHFVVGGGAAPELKVPAAGSPTLLDPLVIALNPAN